MDFLKELNESLNKVYQKKLKEGKYIITTSELFAGAKEYMDIGEYFERFCNDHNTVWQFRKVDNVPIDFSLCEEVKTSGDRTQDCTVR